MAQQGGPRPLDAASVLLPARSRRAAPGPLELPGSHAAGPGTPTRRLSRPPAPGVVREGMAQASDLRRGRAGLPLVARHRRTLVGPAAAGAAVIGAPSPAGGAAVEAIAQTAQHPLAAPQLYADAVSHRLAPVPEGEPPRPESRPERRGPPPVCRGGLALETIALGSI